MGQGLRTRECPAEDQADLSNGSGVTAKEEASPGDMLVVALGNPPLKRQSRRESHDSQQVDNFNLD